MQQADQYVKRQRTCWYLRWSSSERESVVEGCLSEGESMAKLWEIDVTLSGRGSYVTKHIDIPAIEGRKTPCRLDGDKVHIQDPIKQCSSDGPTIVHIEAGPLLGGRIDPSESGLYVNATPEPTTLDDGVDSTTGCDEVSFAEGITVRERIDEWLIARV